MALDAATAPEDMNLPGLRLSRRCEVTTPRAYTVHVNGAMVASRFEVSEWRPMLLDFRAIPLV